MPSHGDAGYCSLCKRWMGHLEKASYSSPRIRRSPPHPRSGLTLYLHLFVFEATEQGAGRYNLQHSYWLLRDRKCPLSITGTMWRAGAESKRGAALEPSPLHVFVLD